MRNLRNHQIDAQPRPPIVVTSPLALSDTSRCYGMAPLISIVDSEISEE